MSMVRGPQLNWENYTRQLFSILLLQVGEEDQAQRESYIKIHQQYPNNRANSRHIKTNDPEIVHESE